MNHALRTIAYFLIWGTFYGLMLGAWSGTAIFPGIGTAMAAGWGIGIIDAQNGILGINKTPLVENNVIVPIQIVEVNRLPPTYPVLNSGDHNT